MLQVTAEPVVADDADPPARERQEPAAIGPITARLCRAAESRNVLAILSDERRAAAAARAAARLCDSRVVLLPAADALAGSHTGSTPAIAGRRIAALAAARDRSKSRLLFVTDAAAAAQLLPGGDPPEPVRLAAGAAIDPPGLAERLADFGYWADERVDEAGEFAVRGAAIDIFPSDATSPVRLHVEDGRIASIEAFDPLTQLSTEASPAAVAIFPAREPELGAGATTLFDLLPDTALFVDPQVMVRQSAAAEPEAAAAALLSDAQWREALARRRVTPLLASEEPGRRFVELARPDRALLAAVRKAREAGDRVLFTGTARDLRFLARRSARQLGAAPDAVSSWAEIESAAPGSLLAAEAEFDRGWSEAGLLVIAAADVLGARASDSDRPSGVDPLMGTAAELRIGDAVVHEEHGLGALAGLDQVTTEGSTGEAIRLLYAGDTQRLVPVEEAGRLWRYGAEADAVSLDRLDGSSWAKRRADIDATLAETARQLVALAAERAKQTAPVLEPKVADYVRFAAGFGFAETPDQSRAIAAVRDDLAAGRPMNRLVVGDVGYGKTEVALRAAALAALAGRQVAVVAPTTVLVRQHVETFRKRFAAFGIDVAGLSRLSSAAEAKQVKAGLADGTVPIVVGTRMIAGKGVRFAELGLVVVDEEQRFGTADKAKLRALGADVHLLTLTATPIPRTLQTALVGLQDLSLIATPPARRQPTRTAVLDWSPEPIRAALLREKARGGQSFVVVPRIEDMAGMAERLTKLAPELRVIEAHGKLTAADIDEAMVRFADGGADVLLATNIIEAGLDIPRANTMLVWRADRFGLAQLHQLRGRVGRGALRGTMLLLTEEGKAIAPATLKRLQTMEALDQLGAGFAISARDLDLRGAGELLGEEQAGHSRLIGLELYQHLLGQALRTARGETVDDWTPELRLGVPASLPAAWIPEEEVRINVYVRLARASSLDAVEALADELDDRFGTLPDEARSMIETARIRQLARSLGIARIDAGPAAIALTPRPGTTLADPRLEEKGERLLLRTETAADDARLASVRALLESLADEA